MTKKILLVEDEALVAMNEAKMLEKHGFEVVTVYNGEKAVEAVDSDPEISLILMDIDLGKGMDGTETAGEILSHHDIPIIFLTSHSEKEMVDKVKGITRYGYVLKNAGEFVLLESITMAFELFNSNNCLKKENEERLRVEKTRDEYYRHLSSTFSAVDNLLALVDKNYQIILSNWKDHEWVPVKEREERPYCYKAFKGFESPCKDCPTMQTFKDGKYRKYEDRNPIDGSYKKISIIPIFGDNGEVKYVLENVQDITDYKELQEKYRGLFENAPLPYQSLDENGCFLEINPAWLKALGGYTREKVIGKPFTDFLHPDSIEDFRDNFEKLKKYGAGKNIIYKMQKKNGEYIDVFCDSTVSYTPDGTVKQTHCIIKVVTERERTEELDRGHSFFGAIVENIPTMVFMKEVENLTFFLVNRAAEETIGMKREDLIGKSDYDLFPKHEADFFREKDLEVLNGGKEVVVQEEELTASDKVRYLFTKKVPIFDEEGKPQYLLGISEDITELKNALEEKDFLMKELNHRVKNNLNMVSSLINLKDSETDIDLSDIQHQIGAISLIHEKLFQTGNVTEIGFQDYISDLLNSIFSSFSRRPVKIETNIDKTSIPTKSAMSLGLIVNEIATNAIKHGFNEEEEAIFSIKMEKDKEKNRYELTLSNTGNSFPEKIDVDNPQTLGLRLISALTEQLGGTIDLKREPHPVFTIRFPIEVQSS